MSEPLRAWLDRTLPEALAERARPLTVRPVPGDGPVVAWVRVTLRAHQSPVLAVAAALARSLDRELLVYYGLGERYPWANDRLHTYALQAARDMVEGLAARGVPVAAHVECPGHRQPTLQHLGALASLLVVDELPVPPWTGLTARVADRARGPTIAVDASTVVPMRLLPREERAFAFRERHAPLARVRLSDLPDDLDARPYTGPLPFEPVDLRQVDLSDLVAAAEIDHTIAPVPHTPGGERAAWARWRAFRDGPLRMYAARRNDALEPQGASRLSAALHFGCIPAWQVAREALQRGAAKYADELLTWRELAWVWCHHTPDPHGARALPAWARAAFARHAGDPRRVLPERALWRGETGDALWDAAQAHLLRHGELHNNVRMTWGKAFAGWTRDLDEAVALALDFNHRLALDGRDPASYGGVLWSFGLFDRPHDHDLPITGAVRARPTAHHATRLDVDRYAAHTRRPALDHPPKVIIIGAGLAGCAAARTLTDHGVPVMLIDRGRGPGGRASSRRADALSPPPAPATGAAGGPPGPDRLQAPTTAPRPHLDHGAPRLDGVRGPLRRQLELLATAAVVREDDGAWLPVGPMSAVCRTLAEGVPLRAGATVSAIERIDNGVRVHLSGETLDADVVIVATAAPQAAPLLAATAPGLAAKAASATTSPAWVVLGFGASPPPRAAFGPPVRRVQHSPAGWVIEAEPAWAAAHLDDPPEPVRDALCAAAGLPTEGAVAHRWRFARSEPVDVGDGVEGPIAVCGDWTRGGDAGGALGSGFDLAGRLLARFAAAAPPAVDPPRPSRQPSLFG
jgi:predicted NAD/FAD-dependent oxidoreductase